MKGIFAIIGLICVQGSTLFQLVKFVHKKQTKGVSIAFWWTILIGLCFYLVYSVAINDIFYQISNAVGIFLSSISIILYYYYRHQEEKKWQKVRKYDRKNYRSDPYSWLGEDSDTASRSLGVNVEARKEGYH